MGRRSNFLAQIDDEVKTGIILINIPQYISIYQAVGLEEPVVTPPVVDTIVEQKTVERMLIKCGTGTEDVNGICQVIQTEEKSSSVKIYHSRR